MKPYFGTYLVFYFLAVEALACVYSAYEICFPAIRFGMDPFDLFLEASAGVLIYAFVPLIVHALLFGFFYPEELCFFSGAALLATVAGGLIGATLIAYAEFAGRAVKTVVIGSGPQTIWLKIWDPKIIWPIMVVVMIPGSYFLALLLSRWVFRSKFPRHKLEPRA